MQSKREAYGWIYVRHLIWARASPPGWLIGAAATAFPVID
jgi:hypothetical protein